MPHQNMPQFDSLVKGDDYVRFNAPTDDAADSTVTSSMTEHKSVGTGAGNEDGSNPAAAMEVISLKTVTKEAPPNVWNQWNSGSKDKGYWEKYTGSSNEKTY